MASDLRRSVIFSESFLMGEEDAKEKKVYTRQFFQRPLSFGQAATFVFIHYMAIGIVQGYYISVQFSLQAHGAGDEDQSIMTMAIYPYSFKFLFSPLLDRFFIRKVGRSKTYIILGGLVAALIFFFLGNSIESMVKNLKVVPLTLLFGAIHLVLCIVQIAGEAWILTMFDKEGKTKASTYLNIGQGLGNLLGFNIFTPLNDVVFLNEYIFTRHQLNEPLISHSLICMMISVFYFVQILVNILFIAEEKIKVSKKQNSLWSYYMILPRHFTNANMRAFVFYMFATRFIYYQIDFIFDLRLIKNGYHNLGRVMISNIDTLTYPLVFVISYTTVYYMKEGQLIRMCHLNMCVVVILGLFQHLNFLNLTENGNVTLAIMCRVFSGIVASMDFTTFFLMSYFNLIVNKAVGNTGITALNALLNQTNLLPRTLGLYLSSFLPWNTMVFTCLIVQAVLLIIAFPFALKLDKKDPKLFDLSEPIKNKRQRKIKQEDSSEQGLSSNTLPVLQEVTLDQK